MPELLTRAMATTSSVDLNARTVDVIFASGTPVMRRDFDGPYREVLAITRDSIDTSRLDAGMSLLDSHRSHSVDVILGTVLPSSFRIQDGKAMATVKLSRRPSAQSVLEDLADGHRLPISVGYRINTFELTEAAEGEVPTLRATHWTPMEVSIVPVPADHNAQTRAHEEDMNDVNTTDRQDTTRKLGIRERRTFVNELLQSKPDFVRSHAAEVEELISDTRGMTETQIREEVLGLMAEVQDRVPTFPHSEMRDMGSHRLTRSEAMVQALLHRADPSHAAPDQSREFVGRTIVELARSCLEGHGVNTIGENASTIISRAMHSTSDFPLLMGSYANVTLQKSYEMIPSPLKQLGSRTIAQDFRNMTFMRLSDLPELKKVNEAGEFTRGTMSEAKETYAIGTYGRVFAVTRQLLINDNLGAINRALQSWGRKAAELESKLLRQLLESNPAMGDGKALFHADHKNLETGAALTHESLEAAVLQMRKQTDMNGEYAGVNPRYLLVPGDLEFVARRLLAEISPATSGDVNPLAKQLTLVVDPGLTDAAAWYLTAAPAEVDGLDFAHLAGQEQPFFDEHVGFNVDGMEFKLRHDFGAGFIDWRGWYRNPGQ